MNPTLLPASTPAPGPAAPPLMTADEFVRLHGDESGVELVDGHVVRLPMPGADHGGVCSTAGFILYGYVKQHGLGRVMTNDTFVRAGANRESVRGADVCFISYARLPKDRPLPKGPIEPAPDLVFEVRSPTDRRGDTQIKVGEYLTAGVTVVVLLDPATEAATVYREADELPQRFAGDEELTVPDVLPGFAVPVKRFFE